MSDLISRQAAIDATQGIGRLATLPDNDPVIRMSAVEYVLFNLPSAQPNTCDGCMWEDAFGYGECYRCKRAFSDMYEVKDEE